MIRYIIKNNWKLMFRNPWNFVIFILGPLIVMSTVSSAFTELMKSYEDVGDFTAGYRIEQDSMLYGSIDQIKKIGKENGITFCEYPDGNPKDMIQNGTVSGFVEFTKDSYVVYQSDEYEAEGITLEYFLGSFMRESANALLTGSEGKQENDVGLPIEKLEYLPPIDAVNYYGIIEVLYFSCCGILCIAGVLSSEKKYGIEKKYHVSGLSSVKIYLSKLIPNTLIAATGLLTVMFIMSAVHGIHWGNVFLAAGIVILLILAGSSFSMMIYHIFNDNLIITIILLFTTVWFMGYMGGSFETYLFSSTPDAAKQASLLYHANRALVEVSCMGHSDYIGSAALYAGVVTILCSAAAIAVSSVRKRGKA